MLETAGISILLKAVDFLFDEGRKILEERRERRKVDKIENLKEQSEIERASESQNNALLSKEEILSKYVDQISWASHEQEIRHLMSLLEIYYKNYRLAQMQFAKWGNALVPPIILNNLEEAEDGLIKTMKILEKQLSEVYGTRISLTELDQ